MSQQPVDQFQAMDTKPPHHTSGKAEEAIAQLIAWAKKYAHKK